MNGIYVRYRIMVFFIPVFLLLTDNLNAQKLIDLGFTLYPGYTVVNFEKALGYSDEYMNDWDQFYYSATLKGFLTTDKAFNYGAEIGWQRLYYAYYIVPYGQSPVYREFNISTFSIMGLARYSGTKRFFVLAGAGIHFFYDGVAPALLVEPGYFLKVGENLKIPVSVRIYPIFGDGIPTPVSFGIGVNYVFKKLL